MNILEFLLSLNNQIKIYHWNTESHAEHEAFGDTYSALDSLIDEFIETYMGKYGRIHSKDKFTIYLMDYSTSAEKHIKHYIDYLSNEFQSSLKKEDTDLLNIRDEMVSKLNKLIYLLSLK